ncbi:MAG: aldehyde dehydrogenase family protein [Bacteriovoracaceae bacterium]
MKFELKGDYFNNEWVAPKTKGTDSTERFLLKNSPCDNQSLWMCPIDYRHIDPLVESAAKGHKVWRGTSFEDRKNALKRYQEKLLSKKNEIAEAISWETGKPLWESLTEAGALISKIDVTINDSLPRISNKEIEDILPDTNGHIIYRPLGPCFIIGPFNFPCHLANGQITSALLAGNSIIFKPSEKTCYSSQLMFECLAEADFPNGVVNFIQGDGESASRIVKRKEVKGIFFTGSKEVGKLILKQTSGSLDKLVALELGGKNSSIICKDAQLDLTIEEVLKGSFLTTGQRCTSTALVPIHRSIMDEFLSKFHDLAKKLIIDHPFEHEKEPFMGPLIDELAVKNYLNFIGMAKREGIEEIMRGKKIEKKHNGNYVTPSIHLAEKFDSSSLFLMSEIFGPNCTFVPFDELDEAIAIANGTEYGLAASIFTKDINNYKHCINEIETGLVNLNRSTVGASSRLPFGGVKSSGNYRPAAVTTIDSCVYMMSSLEYKKDSGSGLESIKGLDL